jgi:hypothetical protein
VEGAQENFDNDEDDDCFPSPDSSSDDQDDNDCGTARLVSTNSNDDDDDFVPFDGGVGSDDEDDNGSYVNPTTTPARRRSVIGRSVTTARSARRNSARPSQRRVLFADDTEQSDGLKDTKQSDGLVDTEQSDGLEDIAVEADSSSFDEYEQLNPEALAVLDEESERHEQRRRDALLAKEGLIGQKVTVKNANRTSEWKVIANIDSFDEVTAKQRPDDEIGMIGIDFNRLTEAAFPLVEIFLRLWPGDAEQQLTHLNAAFASIVVRTTNDNTTTFRHRKLPS